MSKGVVSTGGGSTGVGSTGVVSTGVASTGVASRVVIWVVFALLYAYPLFEGVSNLIALPPYYEANGIGAAVPWWLLVIGVAAPVLLYLAALWIGRRRELFARTLILAVGLAATNALVLSAVSWAAAVQPPLP